MPFSESLPSVAGLVSVFGVFALLLLHASLNLDMYMEFVSE